MKIILKFLGIRIEFSITKQTETNKNNELRNTREYYRNVLKFR